MKVNHFEVEIDQVDLNYSSQPSVALADPTVDIVKFIVDLHPMQEVELLIVLLVWRGYV